MMLNDVTILGKMLAIWDGLMDLRVILKYVYGHYLCFLAIQSVEICWFSSLMVCSVNTCFISMQGRSLDRVWYRVVQRKIWTHSLFVPSLQHISSYTQNVVFGHVSSWHPTLVI